MTLDRFATFGASLRPLIVVDSSMHRIAQRQVGAYAGATILPQPEDRGTAAGLLLALAYCCSHDAGDTALILPTDHGFANPEALRSTVRTTCSTILEDPERTVLIGAPPTCPAIDLGWVLPDSPFDQLGEGAARKVVRFVEKPSVSVAKKLHNSGALWNTMILAAQATTLWCRCERTTPALTSIFHKYERRSDDDRNAWLREQYRSMPEIDISDAFLDSAEDLWVTALPRNAGWTDLGAPDRLRQWLANHGHFTARRS
jgi:mannose-1-phosphate guanylyltransferase